MSSFADETFGLNSMVLSVDRVIINLRLDGRSSYAKPLTYSSSKPSVTSYQVLIIHTLIPKYPSLQSFFLNDCLMIA